MGRAVDLERALAIKGWMHPDELHWLARHAYYATTIVEVGCHRGRSTRALADHCQGVVYCVDPWTAPYYCDDGSVHRTRMDVFDHFSTNLGDHLSTGRVRVLRQTFADALPQLRDAIGDSADLVFIDGDHRLQACSDDIARGLILTRKGGVLAGHDYTHPGWPGVAQAVDQWFGRDIHLSRSIWWTRV